MNTSKTDELRRVDRTRRSDAVFWRRPGEDDYEMGWALESSPTSIAFAWRGDEPPRRGDAIEIHRRHTDIRNAPFSGLVIRSKHAHSDLIIVVVELDLVMQETEFQAEVVSAIHRHGRGRAGRPARTDDAGAPRRQGRGSRRRMRSHPDHDDIERGRR